MLIGCECSGVVRRAFRELGHDAWSCDLLPAEDSQAYHMQCDIFEALKQRWDLGIFHPPCDYLTVSGNRWFSDAVKAAEGIPTGAERRRERERAVEFIRQIWGCSIYKVAIENPIGRLSTLWGKPSQIVQPFHFGDPYRKATCLWLRGLSLLTATSNLQTGEQSCWKMGPSKTRKTDRSRTYPGFAKAMAEQWGRID